MNDAGRRALDEIHGLLRGIEYGACLQIPAATQKDADARGKVFNTIVKARAIAQVALAELDAHGEHRKHPSGDYCVFCREQWPCAEAEEPWSATFPEECR